jgi:hypothetical protein
MEMFFKNGTKITFTEEKDDNYIYMSGLVVPIYPYPEIDSWEEVIEDLKDV